LLVMSIIFNLFYSVVLYEATIKLGCFRFERRED
jgi:hypothetical protein